MGWRWEDDGVTTTVYERLLETTVREPDDGGLLASGDGSANDGDTRVWDLVREHTRRGRENMRDRLDTGTRQC